MNREIKFKAWETCNKYEISTDGRVYSNDYNHSGKRKELRQYLDDDGYPYVFLWAGGKRYKRHTHRLVAKAFIEKPKSKTQVNHKNGVRHDNDISNLEWVTSQENTIHGYKVNGRKQTEKQIKIAQYFFGGTNNPKAKIDHKKASIIKTLRNEHGISLKELSQIYGISVSQVSAIARGKFWNDNPELLEVTP